MTKLLVLGVAAVAIAGGVASEVELGGKGHSPARSTSHARHYRDGPVHGLMLLPLADPDGRVPTADRH